MIEEKTTIAEQLRAGKTVAVSTHGVSMQPLLYENKTHVLIEPLNRDLKVGELPVFLRSDGKYVLHRVIRVDDDFYYTRGDNCIGMEKVPKERMLGVVTEIYRNGRYIKMTDRSYCLYVSIWQATAPLRIFYFRLRAGARRIYRSIRKRVFRSQTGSTDHEK